MRYPAYLLIGWTLLASAPAAAADAKGSELFSGAAPLQGRLYTQSEDMPTAVTRCANCHAHADSASVPYSNAPRLTQQWLEQDRKRRGGPRSHYDVASFCTLLRTGVGPDRILINVEMPRYSISDADCAALWSYLTG